MNTAQPIRRDEVEEYLRLDAERKALDQKSRTIAGRLKQLAAHFFVHLKAKGLQSARKHGAALSIVPGRASVKWKDQFIRVAGIDEAERIAGEAPTPEKIQVVKAS